MAFQTGRSRLNRSARNNEGRLSNAVDARLLSDAHPTNYADGDDEDSHVTLSSDSESSCDSDGESGLAASFRVVSESILRMEQTELEMAKAREASRLKAEKQRTEVENELTQMLLQTQLQMASLVSRRSPSRKRKRVEENEPPASLSSQRREGALGLSLLQCNWLF